MFGGRTLCTLARSSRRRLSDCTMPTIRHTGGGPHGSGEEKRRFIDREVTILLGAESRLRLREPRASWGRFVHLCLASAEGRRALVAWSRLRRVLDERDR